MNHTFKIIFRHRFLFLWDKYSFEYTIYVSDSVPSCLPKKKSYKYKNIILKLAIGCTKDLYKIRSFHRPVYSMLNIRKFNVWFDIYIYIYSN